MVPGFLFRNPIFSLNRNNGHIPQAYRSCGGGANLASVFKIDSLDDVNYTVIVDRFRGSEFKGLKIMLNIPALPFEISSSICLLPNKVKQKTQR